MSQYGFTSNHSKKTLKVHHCISVICKENIAYFWIRKETQLRRIFHNVGMASTGTNSGNNDCTELSALQLPHVQHIHLQPGKTTNGIFYACLHLLQLNNIWRNFFLFFSSESCFRLAYPPFGVVFPRCNPAIQEQMVE